MIKDCICIYKMERGLIPGILVFQDPRCPVHSKPPEEKLPVAVSDAEEDDARDSD